MPSQPTVPLNPQPTYVELETSRRCNRLCAWCPNSATRSRRSQELMGWPLFTALVEQLASSGFTGWIALHNYNEPLLNERLLAELEHIAAHLPHARTTIYTNGDVLDRPLLDHLCDHGLAHLRITRYPAQVTTKPDPKQLRRWLSRLLPESTPIESKTSRHGHTIEAQYRSVRVEAISPDIAGTYNNRGETVRNLTIRTRQEPCSMMSTSISIDYLGNLKMCSNVIADDAHHAQNYLLGSLEHDTLRDLWESRRSQDLRSRHQRSDWTRSPVCATCIQQLPENRASRPDIPDLTRT